MAEEAEEKVTLPTDDGAAGAGGLQQMPKPVFKAPAPRTSMLGEGGACASCKLGAC